MKTYRRFIRIGDRLEASPQFTRKVDAEEWYHQKRRQKNFIKSGMELETSPDDSIRFIDYAAEWFKKRKVAFGAGTHYSDEQRLRDYILPFLSELPISTINISHIRNVLKKISEPGYRKDGLTISQGTRDRVKALMSVIFTDALNEDPPLVKYNPVHNIKISESKTGRAMPRTLEDKDACLKFLKSAQEIGEKELVVVSLFLMTGGRKQEVIALKWSCVDHKKKTITISEKYVQASNSIVEGTKAGKKVSRSVPVPDILLQTLKAWRASSAFSGDNDFIVPRHDGRFHHAREISSIIEAVRKKAGVDISAHGLRHTYGREFALNTGNIKVLQAILGHSVSSTTDLYSDLAGARIKGFGESVSFDIGVKGRGK